jgi:hypothetical protein
VRRYILTSTQVSSLIIAALLCAASPARAEGAGAAALLSINPISVPIIESGRITGQFRVVLKLVPQTPEDGAILSAHQPAIQSILLSAANEYARLNVSTFRPVNVKTLRKLLLDAVRKPGHKVKDVLVIDALAF